MVQLEHKTEKDRTNMANLISSFSINASVYQLVSETLTELRYSSMNDLIRMIISITANKKLVTDFYHEEANRQLEVYRYISKMMGEDDSHATLRIRVSPDQKQYLTDENLLAGLMFLNIVDTDPTNVFHLTDSEITNIISSHTF